tara:strand:+ start:7235 stop:11677 length:4443 start_codon:yes stop_codon:yes gene_type:complete
MKIFINIIENEISNIINITFNNFIKNKKLENIIKKEKNVSKIIENINNISDLLIQKIDIKKIKEIINLKENIPKIILFIKTYLFYYILLFTSFYLKEENFIDLIIKIQNITSNKLLINNNDSKKIINLYNFLTQVKFILNNINTDKFNNELKYNIKYKLVIQFINKYVTNDNLKFYVGNSIENYHNIIFFILIQYNYVNDDIKYIYKLLDDNNNIIYKYINIVVPLLNIIDKNTLETVFNNNLQRPDFINDVYNILKYEKKIISEKEKLNIIMKQNIIFPIVEDVLRYNKVSDSFDKNNTKFDKSNTKIKYIVSNINEIQNYNIKNDEEKKKIDKLFYKRLEYRNAILFNDIEEINIIRKLFLKGKTALENNDYINSLLDIRKYIYLNYNKINNGFSYEFDNTITAVRYTNIKYIKNKNFKQILNNLIELRVASKNESVNIVGFVLSKNNLKNNKIKNLINIKDNNDNLNKFFYNFLKNKGDNNSYYFIFNNKDYSYINMNNQEYKYDIQDKKSLYKFIINLFYNYYTDYIYYLIKKKIKKAKKIYLYDILHKINQIQNNTINIRQYLDDKNIYKYIYNFANIKIDKKDSNENIINGLDGTIINLPKVKIKKNINNILTINTVKTEIDKFIIFTNKNIVCQHHIDYYKINKYKKNVDLTNYSNKIYNFIDKYGQLNNNMFICKSCGEILNIKRYIINIYDLSGEEGYNIQINTDNSFINNKKYTELNKIIDYLDKLIEKIALISNISIYIGSDTNIKYSRNRIIKKIIDLINENYLSFIKLDKKYKENRIKNAEKYYGILPKYSKFFIFKLTNDIFRFKSKEDDKYKNKKINNILLYVLLFLLVEINKNHIINLKEDKIANIIIFNKFFDSLFEKKYIYINNKKDIVNIKKYPILCYILFYFSCMLINFKLWNFEIEDTNSFNFNKVKIIINSFIDLINFTCENNSKFNNYILKDITSLFFYKEKELFNDKSILKLILEKQQKTIKYNKDKNVIIKLNNKIKSISYKYKYTSEPKLNNISLDDIIIKNKNIKTDIKIDILKLRKDIYTILYKKYTNKIVTKYDKELKIRKIYLTNNELTNLNPNIYDDIINKYLENKILLYEKQYNNNNILINKYNNILNNNINYIESKKNIDKNIINIFINNLNKIFNNKITYNNKVIFINSNQYIINHDINGNKLKNNIYINENQGTIINNHNIFKEDVLAITYKKYTLYYSIYTNNYLGFKDSINTVINNKGQYLIINYSLKNMLYLLGNFKKYIKYHKKIKKELFEIYKNRNNNLKNIINELLVNLNISKYTTNRNKQLNINTIILVNKKKKIIFNKYEDIINSFKYNFDIDINISHNNYINVIDIIKKNNNSLLYIINELNDLFEINNSNNNIIIFKYFINIISTFFYKNYIINNNKNMLLFQELLTFEKEHFYDVIDTTGIYNELDIELDDNEKIKYEEEKYSREESNDALDYEISSDAESEFGETEELIQDFD